MRGRCTHLWKWWPWTDKEDMKSQRRWDYLLVKFLSKKFKLKKSSKNFIIIFSKKFFSKELRKMFSERIISKKSEIFFNNILWEKISYFATSLKIIFQQNQIFENWSMEVGIWLFFCQLQRPITWMCIV